MHLQATGHNPKVYFRPGYTEPPRCEPQLGQRILDTVHVAPLSAAHQAWRGGRFAVRGIAGVIFTETPKDL